MAASLANGGLCPLSGDQVLSPVATRSLLSIMQVAGMKDYSATFNYKVQPIKPNQRRKHILNIYILLVYILVMIADVRPCCGERRRRPAGCGPRRFRPDGVLP